MPFRLAAPSCVVPDRVGPNCQALAPLVGEVALMLLETRGCQDYDETDLPPHLAQLGLSFHAHLPLDLPWESGAAAVDRAMQGLESKIAFLDPREYVLHPPTPGRLSELLLHRPDLARRLCLENTAQSDLREVWPEVEALDLGVCLDLGHLVSYGQEAILTLPGLLERVRVLHVYGGESPRGHAALRHLPDPGLLRNILRQVREDAVLVVEVFDMAGLQSSLALLKTWLKEWGVAHD
jgi:sugar phosphate isomerase/epimerase